MQSTSPHAPGNRHGHSGEDSPRTPRRREPPASGTLGRGSRLSYTLLSFAPAALVLAATVGAAAASRVTLPPTGQARSVLVLVPGIPAPLFLREAQRVGAPAVAALNASTGGSPTRSNAMWVALHGRRLTGRSPVAAPPDLVERAAARGVPAQLLSLDREEDSAGRLHAACTASLVVVATIARDASPAARARLALDMGAGLAQRLPPASTVLVASPDPGTAEPTGWSWLAGAAAWGLGDGLLTSSTTRTPGLIAGVDLAATVLARAGVPVPPGWEGHPVRAVGGQQARALQLAYQARANRLAMVPLLLVWGLVGFAAAALATVAASGAVPRASGVARVLLWTAAAGPLSFLLAALTGPQDAAGLAGAVTIAVVGLTATACATARIVRMPHLGLPALYAATLLFAGLDLILGLGSLQLNAMSDMPNLGARFYGIGNEYLGLLLGSALLLPAWHVASTRRAVALTGLLGLGTVLLVGSPTLGADFGGALTAGAAVVLCIWMQLGARRPLRAIAGLVLLTGLGAAALVAWDLARPPDERTHVGELAAATLREGPSRLLEVACGKVMLNVRMALTPYFQAGLLAVTPLTWLWYSTLGSRSKAAFTGRPLFSAALKATFAGAILAAILNDTGVVAWALMSATGLYAWLDTLLPGDPAQTVGAEHTRE